MLKATEKLKQEIQKRKEQVTKESYHQTIQNIMYQHWKQDDTNKDYEAILNWFETEYGELGRFAVQIGKYNQQVCNGGHYQYYYNGYAGDTEEYNSNIPLHQVLVQLHMKAELKDETSIKILSLLNELYVVVDTEKYKTDDYEEEEYENSDYMQVKNIDVLHNFDTEYYKLDEEFMEILEQYLQEALKQ